MNEPKFSVGDEIIVKSRMHPHNGKTAKIIERIWLEESMTSVLSGKISGPGWRYKLFPDYSISVSGLFNEKALRPKPKQQDNEAWERFKNKLPIHGKIKELA